MVATRACATSWSSVSPRVAQQAPQRLDLDPLLQQLGQQVLQRGVRAPRILGPGRSDRIAHEEDLDVLAAQGPARRRAGRRL